MRLTFAFLDTACLSQEGDTDMALAGAVDIPLGLGCLRAYAARDPDVAGRATMTNLLFPHDTPEEAMVRRIVETAPDLLAVTCYLWNLKRLLRVCDAVKRASPGTFIVMGGPQVPRDPEGLGGFLRDSPSLDAAVGGEGEETFTEIVKARLRGVPVEGVPGLACRGASGVAVSLPRPPIEDLSRIPSPYLTGDAVVAADARGFLLLETSRGCPLSCSFCDYHLGRHKVRTFPLERLEAELDLLKRRRFEGTLCFIDPILNLNAAHFKEVLARLKGWKPVLDLHPELFDEESIRLLAEIETPIVYLGIQSTRPETMANINRPCNLGRITENISRLRRHPNVDVTLEVVLGLPGDDYAAFKDTMDWALSIRPRPKINLFDLLSLPNAPLASMEKGFGIQKDDRGRVSGCSTFSEEELTRASWLYYAYYYLRFTAGDEDRLDRALDRSRLKPSETLERLGQVLLKHGMIKSERMVSNYDWKD